MQALWLSLKDNVKCGNKLTDVIRQAPKFGKGSSYVLQKENKMNKEDEDNAPLMEITARLVFSKPNNTQARLFGKVIVASFKVRYY